MKTKMSHFNQIFLIKSAIIDIFQNLLHDNLYKHNVHIFKKKFKTKQINS